MIGEDGSDGKLLPAPFVATTVNVYGWPSVSPDTTHDVVGAMAVQLPPGNPVTVQPVAAGPPTAGVQLTVASPVPGPAVAVAPVGEFGTFAAENMKRYPIAAVVPGVEPRFQLTPIALSVSGSGLTRLG